MGEQTLEVTIAGLRADVRRIAADSQAATEKAGAALVGRAVAAIAQEAADRMERLAAQGSRPAVTRSSAIVMASAVVLTGMGVVAGTEWARWHYLGDLSILAGLISALASVAVVGASFVLGHLSAGIGRS